MSAKPALRGAGEHSRVRRGVFAAVLAAMAMIALASPSRAGNEAQAVAPEIDLVSDLAGPSDGTVDILAHPQVACVLRHLIGEKHLDQLRARVIAETRGSVLKPSDGGGFTFGGWVPHAADCERAELWIHPDGRIAGAYMEACGESLRLFANDAELRKRPPPAIAELITFAREAASKYKAKLKTTWISTIPPERVPKDCKRAAMKESLVAYRRGQDGMACNEHSQFSLERLLVRPEQQNKAHFFTEPRPCEQEPCPQRRPGYLVLGDLAEAGMRRGGFTCARHGTTLGWMRDRDIVPIEIPRFRELDKETEGKFVEKADQWGAGLPEPEWVGTWQDGANSLRIRKGKDGQYRIMGEAWHGHNSAGVEGILSMRGRVASVLEQDSECRVMLVHLGAAIVAGDNSRCGGLGVYLNGIYQRQSASAVRPKKK